MDKAVVGAVETNDANIENVGDEFGNWYQTKKCTPKARQAPSNKALF